MSRADLAALCCVLAACATAEVGYDGIALFDGQGGPGTPDGAGPGPGTPDAPVGSPADAPPPPDSPPCVLIPQSGCTSEACDLDPDRLPAGGTVCRPITGSGNELTACTSVAQCGAGYTCIGGSSGRSCLKFCRNDADCTGPGGRCFIKVTYDAGGSTVPGVLLCSENCDPIASTGCPASWGCHAGRVTNPTTITFTACDPAGSGGNDVACTSHASCLPGYSCVNNGTADVCKKNCRVGGTGCTTGMTCYGFTTPLIVGSAEYGVCD